MSVFDFDVAMELHDHRIKVESEEKGMKKGIQKGRKEGIKEGVIKTLSAFVKKGIISIQEAAQEANMSEADFCKMAGLNAAN